MRAALISMTGQPRDEARGEPLALGGRSLARRQLDFALSLGCERVLALGADDDAAAALRRRAVAADVPFTVVADGRSLLGAVSTSDEVLVIAPGLLAEADEARRALEQGRGVLSLAADAGVPAGFERIDLDRAWAGVALIPGELVERLAELPADIEATSALLRIALQARLPERRLPAKLLSSGTWRMIGEGADPAEAERGWLERHLPPVKPGPIAPSLGRLALRPLASRLLAIPRAVPAIAGATAAALAGAVAATAYGIAPLGFALVAIGAVLAAMVRDLARLRDAPFGRPARFGGLPALSGWLVDAGLLACGMLAIEGDWLHRAFPPLVLLGVLHASLRSRWGVAAGDRALLAGFIALAAGFGLAEPGIMVAALALLAIDAAQRVAGRG